MKLERKTNESLVHAFWRHVVEKPDQLAFITNDDDPAVDAQSRGHPASSYRHVTWSEAGFIVAALMVILREELEFKPFDRAVILSWSRAEWVWISLAVWTSGGITVGIDPRYGADQIDYLLDDCNRCDALPESFARAIFVEDASQAEKVQNRKADSLSIPVLDISELLMRIDSWSYTLVQKDIELLVSTEFIVDNVENLLEKLDIDQTALLLYTSGSKGEPKGVRLTHANISMMSMLVNEKVDLRSDDLLLGQLPSNHVFMWNGIGPSIWAGIPAFYCHPLAMKFHVKQLHPTILFGVPKVWVAIYNEVKKPPNVHLPFAPTFLLNAVNSALTRLKAELLRRALSPEEGRFNQCCNSLISSKLQSALGGRLRIRISGGAALPREVSDFFRICHQEIMNGYGATETTGCICVETEEEKRSGSAGRLLSEVGVDFEPSDEHNGFAVMQISGPTVSSGYWNKPEQTAAAFINGKFRSGDLGKLDEQGYLFIGAREDDDGKLVNGEKVSYQEIIEAFRDCNLIEYIVPIFAGRPAVKALIFLRETAARNFLEAHARGVATGSPLFFIAQHPVIVDAVGAEIAEVNEKLGRKGAWKRVRDFKIVPRTPSTTNGYLTVKMEISAKKVVTDYAELVEELFALYS